MNELTVFGVSDLQSFYSFEPTTKEDKITLINAINNPDKRLADCINMSISIVHVLIEEIELQSQDEQTKQIVVDENGVIEVNKVHRTILIDNNNVSYVCVSEGIFSDLIRIIRLFGNPSTWDTPLDVTVQQVNTNKSNRKVLKLKLNQVKKKAVK